MIELNNYLIKMETGRIRGARRALIHSFIY